jgi:phenylacetate-CoA ligase
MPFIRYANGDMGAITDEVCPCGRGLPLLTKLEGRSTDVIYTRSGMSVSGMAIPWNFLASLGVDQFQIVQEDYDNIVILLVVGRESTPQHKEELTSKVTDQYRPIFGEDVAISIKYIDQMFPTEAGKRRIVVSKLDPFSDSESRFPE